MSDAIFGAIVERSIELNPELVRDGDARVVVRRETHADLMSRDVD